MGPGTGERSWRAAYALTLLASAFLLFGVEPLMGKFALPWFGGSPAVWNACLLFFQACLLAGYGYAHWLVRRWAPRQQGRVHLGVVAAVLGLLALRALGGSPLVPGAWWATAPLPPVLTVVAMLALTVGPQFFLLSATAPLLQSWFARQYPGRSPYALYAVSNGGSLVALLAYPVLLEPHLSRSAQSWVWAAGFVAVCAALAVLARRSVRGEVGPAEPASSPGAAGPSTPAAGDAVTGRQIAVWLSLSCISTVLMMASTHQVSEEVSLGPFVWLLPLAVYLLTFMLCFDREAFYPRPLIVALFGVSLLAASVVAWNNQQLSYQAQLACFMVVLFFGCMICHGELFRARPPPAHLSAFYLWVSLGSVLGSLFVDLAAPALFSSFAEYPLSLLACALVVTVAVASTRRRLALAGAFAVVLCAGVRAWEWRDQLGDSHWTSRNFFGVVRVSDSLGGTPQFHYDLMHGPTVHGEEPVERPTEVRTWTYYGPSSGVWHALAARRELTGGALRIGVLGLGTGTLAATTQPGDALRFYEIDPSVVAVARGEGGYFDYLAHAAARVEIALGDARLSLADEAARGAAPFDVLVLDVYTGDAVPAHLLTDEAFDLYRARLAPDGVLAVHISSLFLDFEPVVAAQAARLGLRGLRVRSSSNDEEDSSTWCLLAPEGPVWKTAALQLEGDDVWPLKAPADPPSFTDDRNSLWPLLRSGRGQQTYVDTR